MAVKKKTTRKRPARKAGAKGPVPSAKKKPKKKTKSSAQHSALCKLCKHPERNKIEAHYREGLSTHAIARMFNNLTHSNVSTHMRYFGYDKKRKIRVFDKVMDIINDFDRVERKPIPSSLYGKALELGAKINGELVEKREETIDVKAKIEFVINQRLLNLAKRLGVDVSELPGLQAGEVEK